MIRAARMSRALTPIDAKVAAWTLVDGPLDLCSGAHADRPLLERSASARSPRCHGAPVDVDNPYLAGAEEWPGHIGRLGAVALRDSYGDDVAIELAHLGDTLHAVGVVVTLSTAVSVCPTGRPPRSHAHDAPEITFVYARDQPWLPPSQ